MEATATLEWSRPSWASVSACLGTMGTNSPAWLPIQKGCQPGTCHHGPALCVLPQTMTTGTSHGRA